MEPQQQHPLKKILPQDSQRTLDGFPRAVKQFYYFHGAQLFGSQFPMKLVETLYGKVSKFVYDAGQFFQIMDNQEKESFELKALKNITAESNVFVIDHAITFRYPDFRRLLMENSSLIPRLKQILKYHKGLKKLPNYQNPEDKPIGVAGNFTQIQFDSMGLTELSHLQFPNNTITLSLIGNELDNQQELIKKMEYLDLKVLWLNGNPLQCSQKIIQYIQNSSHIQIFNSKLTKHCTPWGLKFCQKKSINYAFNQNNNAVYRLNLDGRNFFNIDPKLIQAFPNLTVLSLKDHEIITEQQKQKIIHVLSNNGNLRHLYLEYEAETVVYDLFSEGKIPSLVFQRLLVNGHSFFCKETTLMETEIDEIHQNIFKLTGNYRLASSEKLDESSIWYLNDEVGSSIEHSDTPNVKIIPFLFAQDNKQGHNMIAYSLIWPIKDIKAGQSICRDYLNNIPEQKQRSSRLAIWYDLPMEFFQNSINQFEKYLFEKEKETPRKISEFYNINNERQREQIKSLSESGQLYPQSLTLLTDHETVIDNLTHKQIQFVKNLQEANIIFMTGGLQEQKWAQIIEKRYYINQFPYESCVVLKNNLAQTVQSVLGNTSFLMRTYSLEHQLPQFIGDFKSRQSKGEDNLWILKPPNMARSIDMIITDNLSLIIKSMETGPKIAQKYIEKPVLRKGNKVDLRYILLVKSVNPLIMYLYKHFWIRSSNNKYNIDRRYLSTYETQFTVMNYGQVTDFKQIPYKEFIEDFEKDYAPSKWSDIDEKIKKMLRNTFIAASSKYPNMHNERSRAIYGIDIMIDQRTMEPKLLEITFSPDCKRACQYYPSFYNEVFETLFLNIAGENMQRII